DGTRKSTGKIKSRKLFPPPNQDHHESKNIRTLICQLIFSRKPSHHSCPLKLVRVAAVATALSPAQCLPSRRDTIGGEIHRKLQASPSCVQLPPLRESKDIHMQAPENGDSKSAPPSLPINPFISILVHF